AHAGIVDQEVKLVALPVRVQFLSHPLRKAGKARSISDVQRQRAGAAAQSLDLGHHLNRLLLAAAISKNDVGAPAGQVKGGIAAQAAAAAGDESNLALHVRSSLVDGASPSTLLARQFI